MGQTLVKQQLVAIVSLIQLYVLQDKEEDKEDDKEDEKEDEEEDDDQVIPSPCVLATFLGSTRCLQHGVV